MNRAKGVRDFIRTITFSKCSVC